MHQAESSSTLSCLWTGLSLPVALHPASRRRSYLPLRTGQCSRPIGTFTLLLVRTLRRTPMAPSGQKPSQILPNFVPFNPGLSSKSLRAIDVAKNGILAPFEPVTIKPARSSKSSHVFCVRLRSSPRLNASTARNASSAAAFTSAMLGCN
jgi:hypothetical protein